MVKISNIKWDVDKVREFVKEIGYILITKEYKNNTTQLILKDNDGYYYLVTLNSLIINKNPRKFYKFNPYTIRNIKLWCKLNNRPFKLISEEYHGDKKKLEWQCLKPECSEIFKATWNDILCDKGCGYCRGLKVGLSNCLATKNPELSSEWHPTLNDDLTPYDVTANSGKYVYWICKKCGHEWKAHINNRSNGNGCLQCNESKGEKKCGEWLKQNNITYEIQKEFNGLLGIGGKNLSYDFYLPKYNLLIEYQGNNTNITVKDFINLKRILKNKLNMIDARKNMLYQINIIF